MATGDLSSEVVTLPDCPLVSGGVVLWDLAYSKTETTGSYILIR